MNIPTTWPTGQTPGCRIHGQTDAEALGPRHPEGDSPGRRMPSEDLCAGPRTALGLLPHHWSEDGALGRGGPGGEAPQGPRGAAPVAGYGAAPQSGRVAAQQQCGRDVMLVPTAGHSPSLDTGIISRFQLHRPPKNGGNRDLAVLPEVERLLPGLVAELEAKRDAAMLRAVGRHGRDVGGAHLRMWRWHQRRLEAVANLVADVEVCGETMRTVGCESCGHRWDVHVYCDEALICPSCRRRENAAQRAMLTRAIERVQVRAPELRLRFATGTVPHAGTAEQRIEWLYRAMPQWIRAYRGFASMHWWRSIEATAGDDGEGHLHFHAIIASDFVPDALCSAWWGAALERAGCPVGRRPLHVAIERVRGIAGGETLRRAERELLMLARVPWSVEGERGPQRRGQDWRAYLESRVIYAVEARERGAPVREVSVARALTNCGVDVESVDLAFLVDWLADFADLPHVVFDVRIASSANDAAKELAKYTLKDVDLPPALHARLFVAIRGCGRRLFASSAGDGLRANESEGPGCPSCGSKEVRAVPIGDEARMEEYRRDVRECVARMDRIAPRPPPESRAPPRAPPRRAQVPLPMPMMGGAYA